MSTRIKSLEARINNRRVYKIALMCKSGLFLIVAVLVSSCQEDEKLPLDYTLAKNWIFADQTTHNIAGISLEKAMSFIQNRSESTLAILDQSLDVQDSLVSNFIWTNSTEVPDNKKDDDHNGYVDDIKGWNFRGGVNKTHATYGQTESLRILKFFKDTLPVSENDVLLLRTAEETHKNNIKTSLEEKQYALQMKNLLEMHTANVLPYLEGESPTLENLKAIVDNKKADSTALQSSNILINFEKYGYTQEKIQNLIKDAKVKTSKTLNIDFDDRSIQNDDVFNMNDSIYGSPEINLALEENSHGTRVASVAGLVFNTLSRKQQKNLKIMPVVISGNEVNSDKDIAMGIRYAANNGAKVINMSFSKELSLRPDWIFEALQYASKKDVLVITSAGNGSKDITQEVIENLPNDRLKNDQEIISNLIKVAGSTKYMNKPRASWANYSQKDVDLFAPGDSLRTRFPHNKERWDSGSSLSSVLVASIATIIRSTYPSLTAPEVKKILMDSSAKYDVLVDVPIKENPEQQLPFSDLSKSGGIVNAYNAMLMAEEYVKSKK